MTKLGTDVDTIGFSDPKLAGMFAKFARGIDPSTGYLYIDTIGEYTSGNGVVIDGLTVKDGSLVTPYITRKVTVVTGATLAPAFAASGTAYILAKDGIAITLPAAATANIGAYWEFYVRTAQSSGVIKISTDGTDKFEGMVKVVDKDQAYGSTGALEGCMRPASTNDVMTMSSTTTGGLAGGYLRITCTGADLYMVEGTLVGDGNLATPFSNS